MVMSPTELSPEKDCAGEAQQQLLTTEPSSRQSGRPTSTNPQLSKDNYKNKKENLVTDHGWEPDNKIDWQTDRRS
jgi:hypothetical protein